MTDIKYEILKTLIVFPNDGSYHKELNLIRWGNNDPKYDLRGWSEDQSKMTKGVTLTKKEALFLQESLSKINFEEEV